MTSSTCAADSARALVPRPLRRNGYTSVLSLLPVFLLLALWGGLGPAPSHAQVDVSPSGNSGNTISSPNTSDNVAVGPDGTIYVAWHGSNGIRVARSTDEGQSFGAPTTLTADDYEAEIAASSDGSVYVAWVNGSGTLVAARSDDGAQSFGSPVTVGSTSDGSAHLDTDGKNIYLVPQSGQNVFVSNDQGQSFHSLSTGTSEVFSDILVDPETRNVIAQFDDPSVTYTVSTDQGESLGSIKTPSPQPSIFFSNAALSSGSKGRFLLVGGESGMARIDLDDNSSTDLSVPSSDESQGRSVAADAFGNVVTGYVEGSDVKFKVSEDLGDTFGSATTAASASAAQAAINRTNGDVMFLYEDSNGNVKMNTFSDRLTGYGLTVSRSSIDFGEVPKGATADAETVTLTNETGGDVSVNSISTTAPFSVVSNDCPSTLGDTQSCTIDVTFSPSSKQAYSEDLEIATNRPNSPRTVSLTGTGTEPSVSASNSTVSATSPHTANGSDASTLTIEVKDPNGNPVGGLADSDFGLSGLGSASATTITETSTSGTYEADLTNATAEQITVSVTADGITLDDTPSVTFEAGAISASTSTVNATSPHTADGSDASILTIELKDANGNAVGGLSDSDFGLSGLGSASATTITETSTSGTYEAGLTNATAEQITVSVTADGTTLDDTPSVTFEAIGVAITSGGSRGLDRTFSVTPGQTDQPTGVFRLTPSQSGVDLTEATVTLENTGASGVDRAALWLSADDQFEAGGDTELAGLDLDPSTLPSTLPFDGFSESLAGEAHHLFVTVSLTEDADGEISSYLKDETELTLKDGQIETVNGSSQNGFADLSLSSGTSALPVELTQLEADVVEGRTGDKEAVRLTWRTASETGNAGFEVQKAAGTAPQDPSTTWEQIGFVEGAGTTSEPESYQFDASGLGPGTHEFRLRQVDTDGTVHLNRVVATEIRMQKRVRLTAPAPNPVTTTARLTFAVKESQRATVILYNTLGQRVATAYTGRPTPGEQVVLRLDASRLGSGAYWVRLKVGNAVKTRKMTVVK